MLYYNFKLEEWILIAYATPPLLPEEKPQFGKVTPSQKKNRNSVR